MGPAAPACDPLSDAGCDFGPLREIFLSPAALFLHRSADVPLDQMLGLLRRPPGGFIEPIDN